MSSRRFLFKWSWRMVRREWRQQVGVICLITIGVALSVGSVVAAFNVSEPPGFRFGNGQLAATITGDTAGVMSDSLELQGHSFGVIEDAFVKEATSASSVTIRAMDPENAVTAPLLTLVEGSWPTAVDEIGVTDGAAVSSRSIGDSVVLGGTSRTIVAIVENPTSLNDEFVMVADLDDYQVADQFRQVQYLVDAEPSDVTFPAGTFSIGTEDRGTGVPVRVVIAIAVMLATAMALMIVSLLAAAAFAVMARRRSRQYGLLAAAGGTPRQIRQAVAFNGFTVGVLSALLGSAIGLLVTVAVVPRMETSVAHRIDFAVPWWTVLPTVGFVVISATAAAWWPARSLSRQPVVEILSSMRPRPASATRSSTVGVVGSVLGAVLLVVGLGMKSAPVVVAGMVLAVGAALLLSAGLIRLLGRAASRLSLSGRMAGRSIARQQGRSAAFVSAIALALAVPVGIAAVTASLDEANRDRAPNLAENMAIAWAPGVSGEARFIPVEIDTVALETAYDQLRASTSARIAPIQVVPSSEWPQEPMNLPGLGIVLVEQTNFSVRPKPLGPCGLECDDNTLGDRDSEGNEILVVIDDAWVAHPDLLVALDLEDQRVGTAQAISRYDDATLLSHRDRSDADASDVTHQPDIPANTSIASTLMWPEFAEENDWEPVTVGWLVVDELPLSSASLDAFAESGLLIESAVSTSASGVRTVAILIGLLIGLGIVVAALVLLRAETAGETRLLQSIGATPNHHRRLSAMTAAMLAAIGAALSIPIGNLALLVLWADPEGGFPFAIPWFSIAGVLIVLPLLAFVVGWSTSRTEITNLARRTA